MRDDFRLAKTTVNYRRLGNNLVIKEVLFTDKPAINGRKYVSIKLAAKSKRSYKYIASKKLVACYLLYRMTLNPLRRRGVMAAAINEDRVM